MSKYSDKTFEKILDDMPNRVTGVSTMESSYLGTQCVHKCSARMPRICKYGEKVFNIDSGFFVVTIPYAFNIGNGDKPITPTTPTTPTISMDDTKKGY